jgi:hypothetical protein
MIGLAPAKQTLRVSAEERARRQTADDYARASVRLEGFVPSAFSDMMTRRYVAGETTREDLTAAIRAYYGL